MQVSEHKIYDLLIKEIFIDQEFNCRGTIAPIDVIDLARDIEEKGLIQPVIVAPYTNSGQPDYKYRLIAGYRRIIAHNVLQRTHITAIVREDMVDEIAARLFNLSENLQRADLNILQEAKAVHRLMSLGLNRDSIANKLAKSTSWVQIRGMVLALPDDIQQEIAAGMINQSQIRALYAIWNREGTGDELYSAVRKVKEAVARGRKDVEINPNRVRPTAAVHRKRSEILELLDLILSTMPAGIYTRCLAWAAGEITTAELYDELAIYANEKGCVFNRP